MTIAAIGAAAVVAGGAIGGAVALNGSGKIHLSANSFAAHGGDGDFGFGGHGHGRFVTTWSFSTLNDQRDPTFNQLLGINNRGQIAGYFGSGAAGHPNKGYVLNTGRFGSFYQNENFPHAVQTQVIGINDTGVTVGFYSTQNTASMMNNNFGFYSWRGHFHSVDFPTLNNAAPPVNQLLGVNNSDVAVGFYTDAKGNNHSYTYNIFAHRFHNVRIPYSTSVTASGINNEGDIAGFRVGLGGVTKGFLKLADGHVFTLAYPGAAMTQAFGVNDNREVVGTYTVGSGTNAKSFGFSWSWQNGWKTISDPLGVGATTINGVNDAGSIVGFYTDKAGNTDGFLLSASRHWMPFHHQFTFPTATPTATATVTPTGTMTPTGTPTATVKPTTTVSPSPGTLGNHS